MAAGETPRLAGSAPAFAIVALLVLFSFRAGGFFPEATALGAVVLGLALTARGVFSKQPLRGISAGYVLGATLLGLLAVWTVASSAWSDSAARAIVEYDRVLLYLLVFVAFGAIGRDADRLRWMVRGIAAAAVVVCLCGLATRLFPDLWQIAPTQVEGRLSYPLMYWNALGLLAAVGLVMCLALTCDRRETPVGRVLAAGSLPLLGAALVLTLSRGSVAAAAVGILALLAVGRPGALLSGLLASVPTTALAVIAAHRADLLASNRPTTDAAAAQGHEVALVVVGCIALAVASRLALLRFDGRPTFRPPAIMRHPLSWAAGAGVVLAVGLALGAPAAIERHYDGFVGSEPISGTDLRDRLTMSGDNGRIALWRTALDAFDESPVRGHGAGTYTLLWDRGGASDTAPAQDAHSLYVEVLAELGIVGLLLVLATLLLVLGGFLARARGPDRVIGAALFGAGLAWALSAGVDWVWELPAVTLWFFAAGGLALAGCAREHHDRPHVAWRVLPIAIAAALLVLPARVFLSDAPLREGAMAFARADCPRAMNRAAASRDVLAVRPEPHLLIGYCDVRAGRHERALQAMNEAVRLDPANWETHYGLALALAAAGLDPRPQARITRRLMPANPRSLQLLRLFD